MKKMNMIPGQWLGNNNITGTFFRIKLLQLIFGGGPLPPVSTTVTGISPLALVNAVAGTIGPLYRYGWCKHEPAEYLSSIVQQGKVEQNGTPTPDVPVDLVCNNGAVRMVHRSGLPSGYKLLEYVGGSGSQYVITDVYLASTDVVECEFRNSTTTGYGAVYGVFKLGESSALYGNQTYYGYDASNDKVNTRIDVDTEWHSSRHDFVNGTLMVDDTTVTFTPFEFVNSVKNAVLSRYYNNSYGYNWKGYIRKFKVTRNGEVVCDLLPAKDSNDVAGLYDLVSGSFYTAETGTLLEGNEIDDCELIVVGTPEVLSVTATGATPQTASVQNLYAVDDYADTQDIVSGAVTHKVGVKAFDGTETFTVSGSAFRTVVLNDKAANTKVLCSHFDGDVTPTMAVSTMPDLSVKGYGPNEAVFFKYSAMATVEDFKAWLADQYAQGTPVIVLYPLAEKTTETVDGNEFRWDCVTITQASVSDISITTAKSEFTIPSENHPLNILCNNGVVSTNGALGPVETITLSADGAPNQTFTVEDLLGVGDYKDMEEVVSGTVTRKCAVCVYDGTQSIGTPYISSTGGLDIGATVVYYTGAETTEQVTPHTLTVVDGTNTLTSTADDAEMSVTYMALSNSNSIWG